MQLKSLNKLFSVAFAVAIVAGCSSTSTDDTGSSVTDGNGGAGSTTGSAVSTGLGDGDGVSGSNTDEAQNLPTVFYFAFDSSTLNAEARAALKGHAASLKSSGNRATLAGYTDERGTREYNLALGERRAKAVSQFLQIQGVNKSQLEVISWGEEKPAALGSNEAAWAKNRRVELQK